MLRSAAAAFPAALLLSGCSPPDPATSDKAQGTEAAAAQNGMAEMGSMQPSAQDSAATREYKQSMMASMQDMPPFTGDPDRDFMQQMRVHHQAAIQMSETLLKHGKDEQTRALAQEIIKAQRREIAGIDGWLSSRR